MREKLLNNLILKIASLVLAFLLWFIVVQTTDPKDDKDMGNISVKLVNTELLENENKVYEILDNTDTVRVSVYAPRSVLKTLRSSDIIAEADVSKLTDINTVPITFSSVNVDLSDIRGGHDVVRLNVEDRESKYVNLVTTMLGEVAEGYIVTSLTPEQNRIEVSGPKSAVERVKYAGAMIDVSDATQELSAKVDVRLYDEDSKLVERANLVKNVDSVKLEVEVLAVKEVPVELKVMGEPAEGYMATGVVDKDPARIMIAGSKSDLSGVSAIAIPEERLDISGANANKVESINIHEYLPDNVKLADKDFNGRINVTVHIEPVLSRTLQIPWTNVRALAPREDFDYRVEIEEPEEAYYSLEIKGLRERINSVTQESLFGVVDIETWMKDENIKQMKPGTYTIPATFILNNDITVSEAPQVKIVVSEKDN